MQKGMSIHSIFEVWLETIFQEDKSRNEKQYDFSVFLLTIFIGIIGTKERKMHAFWLKKKLVFYCTEMIKLNFQRVFFHFLSLLWKFDFYFFNIWPSIRPYSSAFWVFRSIVKFSLWNFQAIINSNLWKFNNMILDFS